MADFKNGIVPLKRDNYATWKVQCRMALIREGYWNIVNKTEIAPEAGDARDKFMTKRGKALGLIGLTIDPSLLYLVGEEEDPRLQGVGDAGRTVSAQNMGEQAATSKEADHA